jgi:hypothetical protein
LEKEIAGTNFEKCKDVWKYCLTEDGDFFSRASLKKDFFE